MSSSGRSSSIRDHHHCNNYQSFSSTLLEEIYRSFDEERETNNYRGSDHHRTMMMKSTTFKKSSSCNYMDRSEPHDYHRSRANRFVAVDQWIESEKINLRRKSSPPVVHSDDRRQINHSSSTSSSDSSSGIGGFSSSDTESMYGSAKPLAAILKPIRTQNPPESRRESYSDEIPAKKTKKQSKEGNLQRRALKLYSELKKVKQPISPGGKLTSFLNSLFNSGSASKKPNISSPVSSTGGGLKQERESPATTTTSRSCLSKTPSSAGRTHRSVRFVDDDERGHEHRKRDVAGRDSSLILANDEEFKLQMKEKQRRVEEVANELLKKYHHNNRKELKVNYIVPDSRKFDHRNIVNNVRDFENGEDEDEDEEDDDEVSCGSSDLFELENFMEIGMDVDRYGEELPVYETTHVDTNRAIANGFIL